MEAPRSGSWLIALAAALIVGAGLIGWRVASLAREPAAPGAAARPPQVVLTTLDGRSVGLGDFAGRVVVVDFWASWCAPCRLQARILDRLHEELGSEVQFLAVNLGEDRRTVERYVAENAFAYPVLMDPEEQLGLGLDIYALPTVMVLDGGGGISYLRQGISDRGALTAALAAAGVAGIDELPS